MGDLKSINSALISVFHKEGLEEIVKELHQNNVTMYSTGGTYKYIEDLGIPVETVEGLTSYPSILGGRVKTLHPKVFGGILSRRNEEDSKQLENYDIPEIDLVIVDLYPFEQTVLTTKEHDEIIEKIDIGGISLIRAAAKNYESVLVISERSQYEAFLNHLKTIGVKTDRALRRRYAALAFNLSSRYDHAIFKFISQDNTAQNPWNVIDSKGTPLRYGEHPHQKAWYIGEWDEYLRQLSGKPLSYNNILDVDAALRVMSEFKNDDPVFGIIKHTNTCGLASRDSVFSAWEAALEGDPVSAFGGILISNSEIDLQTAEQIDKIFYEVLIAPSFTSEAFDLLSRKKKRILLEVVNWLLPEMYTRTAVGGYLLQEVDNKVVQKDDLEKVTKARPTETELLDLIFCNIAVKHLKSNAIALVKDQQLIGIGCGQTSRVDALKQAIAKAHHFKLSTEGAVMASDAFFPFPDCVEIADHAGIKAVIQPGGSVKDQDSIDYCDEHGMAMVFSGVRHFKH
jgi:phosphoribosylaminoimidazolecarboxamide formyltransferase/IMP cyclohydrolase